MESVKFVLPDVLEAKHLSMFPCMNSLQSCVDMAVSQLPVTDKNAMVGILAIYHNTLLNQLQTKKD